ncbi:DUF2510 domain-containing protein [Streptomyces sp. NPDC057702]|uniref:DUF2510 domain-containing protein n=1 Tax=unclassified Streptomyces TaxID=2593676 RepID=UPI0036A19C15
MTTPPGWYPDPDHQGPGPAPERWWDGARWTDARRAASSVHDAQTMLSAPMTFAPGPPPPGTAPYNPPPGTAPYGAPPAQPPGYPPATGAPYGTPAPGYPGGPGPGQPGGRSRRGVIIGVMGAVVVAAIVAGVLVLQNGDDDGDGDQARPTPSAGVPTPGAGQGGTGGDGPSTAPSAPSAGGRMATDPANGISVPVLDQWTANPPQADGLGITTSPYPCPNDAATRCVRGGVFSFGSTGKGYRASTAEGIAREDIARNAQDSYGSGQRGKPAAYGGLNGHQELKAEAVTVAGQPGYLVRWKADTKKGDDGYVQSVVFPEPGRSASEARMVVVRLGFDVSSSAPPLSAMDEIVGGIRPATGDGEGV